MRTRNANTLIEVIIASAILAMTAVGIGDMVLFTLMAPKKEGPRYEAALAAKKLREQLKSYVTADIRVTANAPGSPPWHLPEDSSCPACWALAEGGHDATAMLPQDMRAGYGATMRYTVANVPFAGKPVPKVTIDVEWSAQ